MQPVPGPEYVSAPVVSVQLRWAVVPVIAVAEPTVGASGRVSTALDAPEEVLVPPVPTATAVKV